MRKIETLLHAAGKIYDKITMEAASCRGQPPFEPAVLSYQIYRLGLSSTQNPIEQIWLILRAGILAYWTKHSDEFRTWCNQNETLITKLEEIIKRNDPFLLTPFRRWIQLLSGQIPAQDEIAEHTESMSILYHWITATKQLIEYLEIYGEDFAEKLKQTAIAICATLVWLHLTARQMMEEKRAST